jgi:hypothetical protein
MEKITNIIIYPISLPTPIIIPTFVQEGFVLFSLIIYHIIRSDRQVQSEKIGHNL